MIDFKTLAQKQIGGSTYPDKKRINLYQNKQKKQLLFLRLFGLVFSVGLCSLFLWLGVAEPIHQAERAELLYQRMEKQVEQLKSSNRGMERVLADYAHYGNEYQNSAEKSLPDRLTMLDTLKADVFPLCVSVSSAVILDDKVNIQCVLSNGSVLSELIAQIETNPFVRYVTAATARTNHMATASENPAAEKEVMVSVTIYFNAKKESGEAVWDS